MKKIVPDPPVSDESPDLPVPPNPVTAELRQALDEGNPDDHFLDAHFTVAKPAGRHNLLTVRPGASTEETLRHVALLLLCAEQVSDEIQEIDGGVQRGLIWSMIHSVEISRALVEALLEGGRTT